MDNLNINFYLQNRKKEVCNIYCHIIWEGSRMIIPTGLKCKIADWSLKTQRIIKKHPEQDIINYKLNMIEKKAREIMKEKILSGDRIIYEDIKLELKSIISRDFKVEMKTRKENFFVIFDNYFKYMEERINNKKRFEPLRVTQARVKEFVKETGFNLEFDTIKHEFVTLFVKHCSKKGLLDGTIKRYITEIRLFMKWAFIEGYSQNQWYNEVLKYKAKVTLQTTLTAEDLKKIKELDLSELERLNYVKHLFLLQCYTGMRWSDLIRIDYKKITADQKMIILHQVKTRREAMIPLTPEIHEYIKFISKNQTPISVDVYNDRIKEICMYAKIDEQITIYTYQGTKTIETTKPKWLWISNHTARRTFITLMLGIGANPYDLRAITGHAKIESIQRYDRSDKINNAENLRGVMEKM